MTLLFHSLLFYLVKFYALLSLAAKEMGGSFVHFHRAAESARGDSLATSWVAGVGIHTELRESRPSFSLPRTPHAPWRSHNTSTSSKNKWYGKVNFLSLKISFCRSFLAVWFISTSSISMLKFWVILYWEQLRFVNLSAVCRCLLVFLCGSMVIHVQCTPFVW